MALLFMDGFDAGDWSQKGWSYGTPSTDTRFGTGRSLYEPGMIKFTPSTQIFIGFAAKVNGLTNNFNGTFLGFCTDSGGSPHLQTNIDVSGLILRRTDGTILQTAPLPSSINPLSWNYYEFAVTIATSGGTVVARVNGQEFLNFTGNTRYNGTSTNIDAVYQATYTVGKFFDDLYICNSTGSAPHNTYLGDVRVNTLVPSAAGSSTQFTPSSGANYTTVDELPFSASDYVSSMTVGNLDMYTVSDISSGATIYGVQNNVIAKKTDAGTISLKPAIKSGASIYYGATTPLNTYDTTIRDLRTTDPNTSVSWTIGGVNALESGFEVA